jgi:hypothetical protein
MPDRPEDRLKRAVANVIARRDRNRELAEELARAKERPTPAPASRSTTSRGV